MEVGGVYGILIFGLGFNTFGGCENFYMVPYRF
jgi:hypothetical protein